MPSLWTGHPFPGALMRRIPLWTRFEGGRQHQPLLKLIIVTRHGTPRVETRRCRETCEAHSQLGALTCPFISGAIGIVGQKVE